LSLFNSSQSDCMSVGGAIQCRRTCEKRGVYS